MAQSDAEVRQQILAHLKSIPLFGGLNDGQLVKIYGICEYKAYPPDDFVCRFGAMSEDLFILLGGRLVARTKAGVDIAYIAPIGVVGEMGMFTNEPRSADVVAFEESIGFLIEKQQLEVLWSEDPGICRYMLENVVKILSRKMYDTNAEIEKLRSESTRPSASSNAVDNIFLY